MKKGRKPFLTKLPGFISYWEEQKLSDPDAEFYLEEAQNAYKEKKYARTCNCLGSLYFLVKDFKLSQELFNKVSKYAQEEDDLMEYAHSLVNLAKISREKGDTLIAELDLLIAQDVLDNCFDGFSLVQWLILEETVVIQVIGKNIELIGDSINDLLSANETYNAYKPEQMKNWLENLVINYCKDDVDIECKEIKHMLEEAINEIADTVSSVG